MNNFSKYFLSPIFISFLWTSEIWCPFSWMKKSYPTVFVTPYLSISFRGFPRTYSDSLLEHKFHIPILLTLAYIIEDHILNLNLETLGLCVLAFLECWKEGRKEQ